MKTARAFFGGDISAIGLQSNNPTIFHICYTHCLPHFSTPDPTVMLPSVYTYKGCTTTVCLFFICKPLKLSLFSCVSSEGIVFESPYRATESKMCTLLYELILGLDSVQVTRVQMLNMYCLSDIYRHLFLI